MKKNWDDKGTEVRQTPQKTKNRDVSNPRKGSYKGNSQITKVSMNKNQITSRITRKNEKKLETVKFGAKKKKNNKCYEHDIHERSAQNNS